MGRALMTPDELRRMDNDLCIIYEKGLKPIKANKYYYFKYPEGKLVEKFKADHNDVQIERGVWRKYNPYNPYEEGQDENSGKVQSLESLDDLFEDTDVSAGKPTDNVTSAKSQNSMPLDVLNNSNSDKKSEEQSRQEELVDIQKELEAKFDELFGSIDEDD
jgi:hypothetical protein